MRGTYSHPPRLGLREGANYYAITRSSSLRNRLLCGRCRRRV